RRLFDKDALTFVALTAAAPPHDDGPQSGVFARPAGEGGVPARQVDEVAQVGARHAVGRAFHDPQQVAAPELFPALVAGGVLGNREDDDLLELAVGLAVAARPLHHSMPRCALIPRS